MSAISAESEYRLWKENVRVAAALGERCYVCEMRRVLDRCADELDRELLRMRCLRGLTVPEMVESLAQRGVYYSQRHVERLIRRAERAAFEAWQAIRAERGEDRGRSEKTAH